MNGEREFENQLVREGIVGAEQLASAREQARREGAGLLDVVVRTGLASDQAVYRSLAAFSGRSYVEPTKLDIPAETVAKVPARFATHYNVAPVQEKNGVLVVAVSEPFNAQLLDDIRLVLKRRIEPAVATPREIEQAIKTLYGVGADTVERILSDAGASVVKLDDAVAGMNLGDETIDASIIKFVNELLAEAIDVGATDVHIEPFEDQLRVRYRIDGILHGTPVPASIRGFHAAIVSRIKIMANMNIAEKRLPQDGKIRASLGNEQFDLRVSILPTPYGETVNLRLLNRSSMFLTLDELGFLPEDRTVFNGFLKRPHGMILITGPTGSGKTTTLYAALSKLNKLEHKIITVEDPIEYQLKGVTQMQVMPQIGFDFSRALRSMLRHDPDIMLVGEIRDYETAEMAIRSSLTGHLVFSTLHTNDAAGAVTRLHDMGVEPFLIASTMIASVAQRLVRRLCEKCAEEYEPEPAVFAEFGVDAEAAKGGRFRRAKGCAACRNTGYKGRVAIYELLPFSPAIKEMVVRQATAVDIKRRACQEGMRTLRESGFVRICQGVTTMEEVLRVTSAADVADAAETSDAAISI